MADTLYGRDRQRRLSPDDQRFLYERAGGLCQRCGTELDSRWHGAHLVSYTHGGATIVEQMEAWCWRCNLKLGPKDAPNAPVFTPRAWQQEAMGPILEDIWQHGVATLHAAPGAGKTFEAAWVFKRLYDAGIVRRLLVVVPTTALVSQWKDELGKLRIHIDKSPRDGYMELEGTVGAAVCYASLRRQTALSHATWMDRRPTLVVWDEVHHLAEKAAWGNAARLMVGEPGADGGRVEHAAAVLNITGTLFRSKESQRIATVRYRAVDTDDGQQIQAQASYNITTADLVGIELRPPDLYAYSGMAQLIDLQSEEIITGEIADLGKRERQAVMRESFNSKTWLRGFCRESLALLKRQLATPVGQEEPLKLLYIAQSVRAAQQAADMLNDITGQDFARLIVGEDPGAIRKLEAAKRERRSCAIVAVQMVTEGFDCKQIATTAYASNRTAQLFVAQAMARNMRVTDAERSQRRMLPAQILIPDNPDLRKAFASALASAVHAVQEEDTCGRCGLSRDACGCPPVQRCVGDGMPRYALLDLDDPRLRTATVLGHEDGDVDGDELNEQWIPICDELIIPATYAPRVAVASRRVRPKVPLYEKVPEPREPERAQANPRDVNLVYRARLQQGAKWMHGHAHHDSRFESGQEFNTLANRVGGIPWDDKKKKFLREDVPASRLRVAAEWMQARIDEHCRDNEKCQGPDWASGDSE